MDTKHNLFSIRNILLYILLLYVLFILLPLGIFHIIRGKTPLSQQPAVSASLPPAASNPPSEASSSAANLPGFLDKSNLPQTSSPTEPTSASSDVFRIKNLSDDKVLTVSAKDFLPAALVCEMPISAPDEALKAQVVAIYTYYTLQRNNNSARDYDFTCNTDEWFIYTTTEKMQQRWADKYDSYHQKATDLVNSVYGQLLTENNEPILSTFFAISNGSTEASANVWGGERSYLVSVASPGDLLSDGYLSTVTLSPDDVRAKLQAELPDAAFDFALPHEKWFAGQELSEAGYTKNLSVCGVTVEGIKLRTALLLSSTCFTVAFDGTNFIFTVKGYGHGVGMSQAGAMYMAQQGSDYRQILTHYYPGTVLSDAPSS